MVPFAPVTAVSARASGSAVRRSRLAGIVAGVCGVILLGVPRRFVGPAPRAVTVARLLRARYGVQGLVLVVVPRPPVRVVRAVDVLHALSMLAFLGSSRYRRPALASAAFSVGLTLLARPSNRR
ncbi:hypothetical protein C5E44_25930 [Nocardia nova]|nr:hypothetical protein C5E44_25930 [Nocardia nova]